MVLENRKPYMAPHSEVAMDIVAAAGALFSGDAQRYSDLLGRSRYVLNYAENLELDDSGPVLIAPADIIWAALIVITRLLYAATSEDISDEDFAVRTCDLLTSVELRLIDTSPEGQWESREEWFLRLWKCGAPDPSTRDEMQWVTLQELAQVIDNHPGTVVTAFDISEPRGRHYGFKLQQTPPSDIGK